MEDVVDQPLAFFLGHASEVQPALPAQRVDPAAIALDEPVERVITLDELGQRRAPRSR